MAASSRQVQKSRKTKSENAAMLNQILADIYGSVIFNSGYIWQPVVQEDELKSREDRTTKFVELHAYHPLLYARTRFAWMPALVPELPTLMIMVSAITLTMAQQLIKSA